MLSCPVHGSPGPLLRERHALFQLLVEGHGRPAQEGSQQRPVSPGLLGRCWLQAGGLLWAERTPVARYKHVLDITVLRAL